VRGNFFFALHDCVLRRRADLYIVRIVPMSVCVQILGPNKSDVWPPILDRTELERKSCPAADRHGCYTME
jgi:hypothetical protein